MPIRISCPGCQRTINAPDSFAGKTARCPACKHPIAIPKPPSSDEDDDYKLADEPAPIAKPQAAPAARSTSSLPPPQSVHAAYPSAAVGYIPSVSRPGTSQISRGKAPPAHSRRYVFLALAIVPLVLMLIPEARDTETRFNDTLEKNREAVEQFAAAAEKSDGESSEHDLKQKLLSLLPDRKIEGAHLAVDSLAHWGYGLLSAALFGAVLWALFPNGRLKHAHAAAVALGTATFGVLLLLAIQGMANATGRAHVHGGGVLGIILLILQFIAFSYHAALDADNGFLLSFFGYTFGVGLCEEFSKTFPLLFRFAFNSPLDGRGSCFWGLVAGAGFGVAEGIIYSSGQYNGIATPGIYLVRFTACVALHAVWSGSAGITIWRQREFFASEWEWGPLVGHLIIALAVPMTLHGLYDTLLKKEMIALAIVVAVASFAWLVFLIETNQAAWDTEAKPQRSWSKPANEYA